MASPATNQRSFQDMQRNAAENAQLARQHQLAMGEIQAFTKTNSSNSKTTMTSINDTSDLVAGPLNQSFKSS